MKKIILILVVLSILLSSCAPSAGEAWRGDAQHKSWKCNQYSKLCEAGYQHYCAMYDSYCRITAVVSKVKALILVNDVAPSRDVQTALFIKNTLENNHNTIYLDSRLDSEVNVNELKKYDLIVRVLHDDVNLFVGDRSPVDAVALARKLKLELQANKNIVTADKVISEITVGDLCELRPAGVPAMTTEIALFRSGNYYTGSLVKEGRTYYIKFSPSTNVLEIRYPDNRVDEIAIDYENKGIWIYQGRVHNIEVDLDRKTMTFRY